MPSVSTCDTVAAARSVVAVSESLVRDVSVSCSCSSGPLTSLLSGAVSLLSFAILATMLTLLLPVSSPTTSYCVQIAECSCQLFRASRQHNLSRNYWANWDNYEGL